MLEESVLDVYINQYILVLSGLQIILEGVNGKSYRGDIAIDDISVTDGACQISSSMYMYTVQCTAS